MVLSYCICGLTNHRFIIDPQYLELIECDHNLNVQITSINYIQGRQLEKRISSASHNPGWMFNRTFISSTLDDPVYNFRKTGLPK